MPSDREQLFVDGVSGDAVRLYPGNDDRYDYRVIDSTGNPIDLGDLTTLDIRAAVEPDGAPDTFKALTFTLVPAPDQSPGSLTRGVFQLVISGSVLEVGDAPGTVRGDFLLDGKVRGPWQARLVVSEAVGV